MVGRAGRVPKKRCLRVMSGKLPIRKDFLNQPAAPAQETDQIFPKPPREFDKEHRKIWRATIGLLKNYGILKVIDGGVLCAYCSSYVRWIRAERELKKIENEKSCLHSLVVSNGKSLTINPLITISNRAKADIVNYAVQLGMTPAARLRMESSMTSIVSHQTNIFARLRQDVNDD